MVTASLELVSNDGTDMVFNVSLNHAGGHMPALALKAKDPSGVGEPSYEGLTFGDQTSIQASMPSRPPGYEVFVWAFPDPTKPISNIVTL